MGMLPLSVNVIGRKGMKEPPASSGTFWSTPLRLVMNQLKLPKGMMLALRPADAPVRIAPLREGLRGEVALVSLKDQ